MINLHVHVLSVGEEEGKKIHSSRIDAQETYVYTGIYLFIV